MIALRIAEALSTNLNLSPSHEAARSGCRLSPITRLPHTVLIAYLIVQPRFKDHTTPDREGKKGWTHLRTYPGQAVEACVGCILFLLRFRDSSKGPIGISRTKSGCNSEICFIPSIRIWNGGLWWGTTQWHSSIRNGWSMISLPKDVRCILRHFASCALPAYNNIASSHVCFLAGLLSFDRSRLHHNTCFVTWLGRPRLPIPRAELLSEPLISIPLILHYSLYLSLIIRQSCSLWELVHRVTYVSNRLVTTKNVLAR